MIALLIVSHGTMCEHLLKSAEMICGPQENVATVCLTPEDGQESYQAKMEAAIASLDAKDGLLVLGDLFGGTPCNVTCSLSRQYPYHAIVGANLPMMLEVLTNRDCTTVEELADMAEAAGKAGVVNLLKKLAEQ